MSIEKIINAIKEFRDEPKFTCAELEFSMLNPSPDSVTLHAKDALRACADDLINVLQSGMEVGLIKNTIRNHLSSVNKTELDTEDREYVAYYFHRIGKISGVNVSFCVNQWLYGFPIAVLLMIFKKG
jgi:hypothetical protein